MKNSDVYNQFKSEIRSHFQCYEDITSSTVGILPFFHAVINETMRLYPPVPFGPPRLSPGAYVNGVYVPKGVSLSMPNWLYSCLKHTVEANPSDFDPPDRSLRQPMDHLPRPALLPRP